MLGSVVKRFYLSLLGPDKKIETEVRRGEEGENKTGSLYRGRTVVVTLHWINHQ